MNKLEAIAEAAMLTGKEMQYVKPCADCGQGFIFDRGRCVDQLSDWYGSEKHLAAKWEKINNSFVRIEALLHATGIVNVHGKVVEHRDYPEADCDYLIVCGKCYDRREQDCYHDRDH